MLREGPVPRVVFGLLQYVLGAVLVAAPFLLSFDSDAATAAAIVAGLVTLMLAATTEGPTSLTNTIPLPAGVVLDVVLAVLFVAAPFLFTFSGESSPTALFIVLGILLLLLTIGTRFKPAAAPPAAVRPADAQADVPEPALSGGQQEQPDQGPESDRDE